MQISMRTGADHLMLSAESSYGPQARKCIDTENSYQKDTYEKMIAGEISPREKPIQTLAELLYL